MNNKIHRAYISGPITGIPNKNIDMFDAAAHWCEQENIPYINPLDHEGSPCGVTGVTPTSWEDYMKRDIKWLLECDTIILLPDWSKSKGAIIEAQLAEALGYNMFYFNIEDRLPPSNRKALPKR